MHGIAGAAKANPHSDDISYWVYKNLAITNFSCVCSLSYCSHYGIDLCPAYSESCIAAGSEKQGSKCRLDRQREHQISSVAGNMVMGMSTALDSPMRTSRLSSELQIMHSVHAIPFLPHNAVSGRAWHALSWH